MPTDIPDFSPSDYRILVVDDEFTILNLMRLRLDHEGYQVEVAQDASIGFERLEHQEFDLAILDTIMVGMHGFDMLQRIRADERWRAMPVIIYGAGDDWEEDKSIELGADAWISKTTLSKPLLATVRDVLLKGHGRDTDK